MKKNTKAIALVLIVAVAILVTILVVYLNSIEKNKEFSLGDYTVISEGSGVSIVGYTGESTSLVIPAKIENKKVVSITADAFLNTKVTTLSFADDATSITIPDKCFANNTTIVSVKLPSGMKNIPTYCFYNCTALKSVTMPDTIEYIGSYAFYGCTTLTSDYDKDTSGYRYWDLPTSLTEICDYAFFNCDQLDCIRVTDKLEVIGNSAFRESALQKIELYDDTQKLGITEIGTYAFYKSYLYSQSSSPLYLPNLKIIGSYAFSSISSNFKYFSIAPSVQTIGDYAFSGNTSLTTLVFEQDEDTETISLGKYLCSSCTALTKVTFVDKITTIPEGMFKGCIQLLRTNNLILSENVETIGVGAFAFYDTTSTSTKYCTKTIQFYRTNAKGTVTAVNYNDYFMVTTLDTYFLDDQDSSTTDGSYSHFVVTDYDKTTLYAYVGLYSDTANHYSIDGSTHIESFQFFTADKDLTAITLIKSYAFAGTLFTKLCMPSAVCEIEANAFEKSTIVTIYFESDSVFKTFTIDDSAFKNMTTSDVEFSCFVIAGASYKEELAASSLKARLDELAIDCELSKKPN